MIDTSQSNPPKAGLRQLLDAASPRRRAQLALVLVLTFVGAIAELVTVGAVIPMILVASEPTRTAAIPLLGGVLGWFSATLGVSPIHSAALLLTIAALAATALRIALNWVTQQFVFGLHQDLVLNVFGRVLRQPYAWYARQHSSVLLSAVEKIYLVAVGVVSPLVNAVSAAVMAMIVAAFLFVINPMAALIATAVVGTIYGLMTATTRNLTHRISDDAAKLRIDRIKTIQESLGGIRDIILDQTQPLFEAKMARMEDEFRRIGINSYLIALTPRLVVEGAVIILVAALALWFNAQPGGVMHALPVLGALALGAQRLLPMIQLVYYGYANYSLYRGSLGDVAELLELPLEPPNDRAPVLPGRRFDDRIELADVTFRYADRDALSGIQLVIRKGERIGLIGKTGSGKSTLVDLIMGLLSPTSGGVIVDGQPLSARNVAAWQAQISHVPQSIFLTDDTIAANIAFGQPHHAIDMAKVAAAAAQAGLGEYLDQLPSGLESIIGERGVRLSGGQRQRIGIARALYKDATVLVLDEATSALDDETEAAVMSAVEELGGELTIILIAHRLSTVAKCDRIYRLSGGRIVEQGSYDEVVNRLGGADAEASR